MGVVNIDSQEKFAEIAKSEKVIVALFLAEWAEQCRQVLDVMTVLSAEIGDKLQFISIAAEDYPEISIKYKIEAVPTVVFVEKTQIIDRIDGVDIASLTQKCKKAANLTDTDLEDRLRGLINKSKVMIFMKGDRNNPRCGFSKQLIEIMKSFDGVHYETFDILSDEDVRQGLKKFSNWPTYPQLYVNGELIGGLDIIKELNASGEFVGMLKN